MATKKHTKPKGNGAARDDVIVKELRLIHGEIRTQGARLDGRIDSLTAEVRAHGSQIDALTSEVRGNAAELRAVRDLLVGAVATDRRRIDVLESRVAALEAGKH